MTVIIANIISLISCTIMMLTGLIKNKNKVLGVQCIQFVLMGTSHFLLGAMGGVFATLISLLRNLAFFKFKSSKGLKIGFIVLQIVLSASTVTINPLTWLPILSTAVFTWFIDSDDIIKFKVAMILSVGMWIIYDAAHLNFTSAAFDVFTVLSTGYSIYRIKKTKISEE